MAATISPWLQHPKIPKPEIASVRGMLIQSEIDAVNEQIEQVVLERQNIKDAHGDMSGEPWESALQDNTDEHNMLVAELKELRMRIDCIHGDRL